MSSGSARRGIPVRFDKTSGAHAPQVRHLRRHRAAQWQLRPTRSAASENNENFVLTGERMLVDLFAKHFEKLWEMLGKP